MNKYVFNRNLMIPFKFYLQKFIKKSLYIRKYFPQNFCIFSCIFLNCFFYLFKVTFVFQTNISVRIMNMQYCGGYKKYLLVIGF